MNWASSYHFLFSARDTNRLALSKRWPHLKKSFSKCWTAPFNSEDVFQFKNTSFFLYISPPHRCDADIRWRRRRNRKQSYKVTSLPFKLNVCKCNSKVATIINKWRRSVTAEINLPFSCIQGQLDIWDFQTWSICCSNYVSFYFFFWGFSLLTFLFSSSWPSTLRCWECPWMHHVVFSVSWKKHFPDLGTRGNYFSFRRCFYYELISRSFLIIQNLYVYETAVTSSLMILFYQKPNQPNKGFIWRKSQMISQICSKKA